MLYYTKNLNAYGCYTTKIDKLLLCDFTNQNSSDLACKNELAQNDHLYVILF